MRQRTHVNSQCEAMVPDDLLYSSQWHFDAIGGAEALWDIYSGTGITVGIFDDGIEYGHHQLSHAIDSTLEFSYIGITYDGRPENYTYDAHGTAVAGLIAAAADGGGGVGLAWDATLGSVNVFFGPLPEDYNLLMRAYAHAREFDVMNNSWGFDQLFDPVLSWDDPTSQARDTLDAMEDGVIFGRGGLGTIIVKSAGNDYSNANGSALNAAFETITVGATLKTGYRADYSNQGPSLLISAPAATVTTDITGEDGYNSTGAADGDTLTDIDHTSTFGGTSAAAGLISGAAALMLQAGPRLGWRDIQNILAHSAAHTETFLPDSDWKTNGAATWNGGGFSFSQSYGYGLLDLHAAVRMAEVWSDLNGGAQTSQETQSRFASAPDSFDTGAANGTAELSLTLSAGVDVEHVLVSAGMTAPNTGYVVYSLEAPDGSVFKLFNTGQDTMPEGPWTFGVAGLRGTGSAGTWTLRAEAYEGATPQVASFSITAQGSAASTDDIHTLTDDFLFWVAAEPGRAILSDSDGGTDTLNLVGVSGNIVVTSLDGGALSVGGTAWATLADDSIENIFAGDGADELTGSGGMNWLRGMRGDDTLWGMDGDDTLDGHAGHDNLDGGGGDDSLIAGLGDDILTGATGHDRLVASGGGNSMSGGEGGDWLTGGMHNDLISGGAGDDILEGDAVSGLLGGRDVLDGGAGDDLLSGGGGADIFLFRPNEGTDTIAWFDPLAPALGASGYEATPLLADFQAGIDTIELQGFQPDVAANVMDYVAAGGGGATFTAEGTQIIFYGLSVDSLSASDFIFS